MNKQRDRELAEKFSEVVGKILSGEKLDLSEYPDDFQETIKFAQKLAEHRAMLRPSFRSQLKKKLLSRLEEESIKPNFWEKLKQAVQRPAWQALTATFLLVLLVSGVIWSLGIFKEKDIFMKDTFIAEDIKGFKKFSSVEEFKSYMEKAAIETTLLRRLGFMQRMPLAESEGISEEKAAVPERVSETTVQVTGIDEPDIVKTDGKEIYFSTGPVREIMPLPFSERAIPPQEESKTNVIKAFPPEGLAAESKIDKSGNLLLNNNNMLAVFSGQEINGYNVSNPESPEKKWEIKLEDDTSIVETRLYKDKIYLVTQNTIPKLQPSPVKLLTVNGASLTIDYREIYHPIVPIPVNITFSVMILNPASGEIEKKISFVDSSGSSVVYMSEEAIYITYSYTGDTIKFGLSFLREKGEGLIPAGVIEKVKKLEGYDISDQIKLLEFQIIWKRYLSSLGDKDRQRVEKELSSQMTDYYREHKRALEKTGIVKIGVEELEIKATGDVPGYPLNQFALDEYKGYLRIATTVGERGQGIYFFFPVREEESANDVYVLDESLNIQGSVKDLGLTERIYSVRFIENKGYLVTFRETDPLYVLDLSNPKKPELRGELKIPGYSSYLQPITKDNILGIGKEDSHVKVSLFDVSLPEKPQELDKYILDEFWSDVLSTHHAFLLDRKHEIFFLPGSQGGYVFSYKNNKLELKKAIKEISARRAIYINDYLYIIGDDKIIVLSEIDWEKVNELSY